jgi:transcriptional regulator with XRE-family HTH domain
MTNALSRFGSYCRDIRSARGQTMARQGEALGHQIADISAIETGRKVPSTAYIEQLCNWLNLSPEERAEVTRRIPRNEVVIAFPRKREGSSTVKLFRKVSKMTPREIRALQKERRNGAPDD